MKNYIYSILKHFFVCLFLNTNRQICYRILYTFYPFFSIEMYKFFIPTQNKYVDLMSNFF